MTDLQYSLLIESTAEPDFFTYYSPDLGEFSSVNHSIEDCIYKAKRGMIDDINLLKDRGSPVPPNNPDPQMVIQNDRSLAAA